MKQKIDEKIEQAINILNTLKPESVQMEIDNVSQTVTVSLLRKGFDVENRKFEGENGLLQLDKALRFIFNSSKRIDLLISDLNYFSREVKGEIQ